MKFKWNDDDQKYIKLGLTALAVIVLAILANQVLHQLPLLTVGLKKLFDSLKPIGYGLVFAYILIPALNLLENGMFRFGGRVFNRENPKSRRAARGISIALVWGLTLLLLSVLVKLVVPELMSSAEGIVSNMPAYVNRLTSWVSQALKDNPEIRTRLIGQIRTIYSDFNSVVDSVSEIMPSISEFVGNLSNGVFNAVSGVFNFAIGIIVSIYVMGAKENFTSQCKKALYSILPVERANSLTELTRSAHRKFGGFFMGKIIDSIIIGVLCFMLLSIFKIPYAVLIGFIVGLTNIIPFFGPFIGAVPSAILILLANPIKCVYFIIIIIALQQFDGNILGPKILSNSIGISSFWVMFSILVFGGLFGFWGLLCGVPVFAVIYDQVSELINHRLKNKGLSAITADYRSLDHIDAESGEIINKENKTEKEDGSVS